MLNAFRTACYVERAQGINLFVYKKKPKKKKKKKDIPGRVFDSDQNPINAVSQISKLLWVLLIRTWGRCKVSVYVKEWYFLPL